MTELLTAAQMRAIERAAIDSGAVTGLELMERAGRGVVEAVLDWRPALAEAPHRAVVLCGPGNNGGDGFVVARLLKERGWHVELFLYGEQTKLPPDAAENCRRWREMGEIFDLRIAGPVIRSSGDQGEVPDLLVDAVFGTGLARPIDTTTSLGDLIAVIGDDDPGMGGGKRPVVVSVDVPSGFCSDSGRFLGAAVTSDLVVTFQRLKVGHVLDVLPTCTGAKRIVDIGLERFVEAEHWRRYPNQLELAAVDHTFLVAGHPAENRHLEKTYPHLKPAKLGLPLNKYDHGHAVVLSGGVGKGGAARLAARGALRIGAGLVTVGVPPAALIENAAQLNAIMLRAVRDADALGEVLADPRINALCLGPGMGVSERTREMVLGALAAERACVLDADALTAFEQDPGALFDALHETCVLTPHAGEFKRLFPEISARLDATPTRGPAYSKVDATREAAALAGCTVLFKGPDTVIAEPSGRCKINSAHYERAAPWLATAGSGDVLAGFIAGLLARGFAPMAAAETAAWFHVECARSFGPGLIAEDLPEQLPDVFRGLGL